MITQVTDSDIREQIFQLESRSRGTGYEPFADMVREIILDLDGKPRSPLQIKPMVADLIIECGSRSGRFSHMPQDQIKIWTQWLINARQSNWPFDLEDLFRDVVVGPLAFDVHLHSTPV